jgi:cytoskeletal protein RodZ
MFKTRQIKTQILGEKLKDARETSKVTIAQISKKTKIPANYLKYIEEGDYKNLPADIYVIAYLRKYAEVLNLDIEEILEQFRAERGISENLFKPTKIDSGASHFIKRPTLIVTPKRIGLILAILVIALLFGYFWHQLSYLVNPPSLKITQPVSDLTVNGQELYVDKKGNFEGVVSLEAGLNILKFEAKDRFGKINTTIRKVILTK